MVHDPCSLKPFPCINQSIATYFHNIDAYGGHARRRYCFNHNSFIRFTSYILINLIVLVTLLKGLQ